MKKSEIQFDDNSIVYFDPVKNKLYTEGVYQDENEVLQTVRYYIKQKKKKCQKRKKR